MNGTWTMLDRGLNQLETVIAFAEVFPSTRSATSPAASGYCGVHCVVGMALWTVGSIGKIMVSVPQAILSVLRLCAIGEVRDRVVGLVIVEVAGFKPVRTRADKGSCNKSVYPKAVRARITGQVQRKIAPSRGLLPTYAALPAQATNPPYGGDFVTSFVSDYGTPLFYFGRLIVSHCENLRDRFELWLGSFVADNNVRAACILA